MAEGIPKTVYVTYVGPESYFVHSGRSREAKVNPYRFIPNTPVKITNEEDVKFFWSRRDRTSHFKVTKKKPKADPKDEEVA